MNIDQTKLYSEIEFTKRKIEVRQAIMNELRDKAGDSYAIKILEEEIKLLKIKFYKLEINYKEKYENRD